MDFPTKTHDFQGSVAGHRRGSEEATVETKAAARIRGRLYSIAPTVETRVTAPRAELASVTAELLGNKIKHN